MLALGIPGTVNPFLSINQDVGPPGKLRLHTQIHINNSIALLLLPHAGNIFENLFRDLENLR